MEKFHSIILDDSFGTGISLGSEFNCKFLKFLFYMFESMKQWLMVSLTLFVLLSMSWPLKYKQFVAKITTPTIMCLTIFSACASVPAIFAWKLGNDPHDSRKKICSALKADRAISFIIVFFTAAQKYPISTFCHLLLTLILVKKLVSYAMIRKKFFNLKNAKTVGKVHRKTINAAISTLAISFVHGAIYIIESIAWETIYINNIANFLSKNMLEFLFDVGKVAGTASILPRMWNFYVYIARNPAFRIAVMELLSCGKIKVAHKQASSTAPASSSWADRKSEFSRSTAL